MTDEDWVEVIQTNLNGCFFCTSAAIPFMIGAELRPDHQHQLDERPDRRRSARPTTAPARAASSPSPGPPRWSWREFGITVNVVAPGFTETDMFAKVPAAIQAQIKAKIPAARFAQPEEIAKAVIFLVADGDYITGQQINVNGGAHM